VRRYALGLLAAAIMLPATLAGAIGVLYIGQDLLDGPLNSDGARACLFGSAIGFGLWLLLGLPFRAFADPAGANEATYLALCEELDHAAARVAALADPRDPGAHELATRELATLESTLRGTRPSRQWLLAYGYVDSWRRIHRIQEALLVLDRLEAVLGEALYDELRLMDSQISQEEELLARLRHAVAELDPGAAEYLTTTPKEPAPAPPRFKLWRGKDDAADREAREAQARVVLSRVRYALDDYRDSRRDGIVRARNNLYTAGVFTGLTSTLLLVVAILGGASTRAIGSAAAFYLVGGLVGLFRQLRTAASRDSATDDFGLSTARLIETPLFSGLAAIGGVVLTAMVSAVIPATAQKADVSLSKVPSLGQIFDVTTNPTGLIVAAVFGLAPSLLIARLQQRVDDYKADLTSSEATDKASAAR
jgi:hypothetical protein